MLMENVSTREKTDGKEWDAAVREDHRRLEQQAGVLESALKINVPDQDRRVVLSWTLRSLWPPLELHLRQEEEALLAALERLLDKDASVVRMLRQEHEELRAAFRQLAELLQDPDHLEWGRIKLGVEKFLQMEVEHEKLGDHILLDVLRYSLNRRQLAALADAYREVAKRAHEEEGWPAPRRAA